MTQAASAESSYPSTVEVDANRLRVLEARSKELGITLKAMAVIAQRLQEHTGESRVVITDDEMGKARDMEAFRESEHRQVVIVVSPA